jgi:hypothetical protein
MWQSNAERGVAVGGQCASPYVAQDRQTRNVLFVLPFYVSLCQPEFGAVFFMALPKVDLKLAVVVGVHHYI